MKRRRILGLIFLSSAASFLGYGGYKYLKFKNPELGDLEKYEDLISIIAETIIPETNTPGANEAGVSSYIIKTVKYCLHNTTQVNFLKGLEDIDQYAKDSFGNGFLKCDLNSRQEILKHMEDKDRPAKGMLGKVSRKLLGDPFFMTIKNLTVEGYFTSRIGATESMTYLPVPGNYLGCVELKSSQKAWASL